MFRNFALHRKKPVQGLGGAETAKGLETGVQIGETGRGGMLA